jgi:site-specific recombinase XerC
LLRAFLDLFEASLQFRKFMPDTQHDARKSYRAVCKFPTGSGLPFGQYKIKDITAVTMRRYMDKRGEKTEKRANAEIAYLSMAFSWGVERGHAKSNPCLGVRRFKLKHRERYVTDEEYAQRYTLAGELGRPDIQAVMELAYLCRLRENEVLKMLDTRDFITSQGVMARRGKGSKTQLIEWSPRLEEAIKLARSIPRKMATPCLIVSPHTGRPLILGTFRGGWQMIKTAASEKGHTTDWHFHDLKAKGVSDFEGDKHKASGHKTIAMTEVYNRLPESVKSTR